MSTVATGFSPSKRDAVENGGTYGIESAERWDCDAPFVGDGGCSCNRRVHRRRRGDGELARPPAAAVHARRCDVLARHGGRGEIRGHRRRFRPPPRRDRPALEGGGRGGNGRGGLL